MKIYSKILLLLLLLPFIGVHAQSKIPDYSLTERKNVPADVKWDLGHIYKSISDWEKDKKSVVAKLDEIDLKAKSWTSGAEKMYEMLLLIDEISEKLDKLATYAIRSRDVDLGDQTFQKMTGDINSIYVTFSTKTSFMDSDVLTLGKENFNKFLSEIKTF